MTDRSNHQVIDDNYKPIITREYHFNHPDGSVIVIQEHSAGHIYGPPGTPGNQGSHFNVRPLDVKTGNGARNDNVFGTLEHYEY
ncbi:HNH/endonuclease VII fold putative polymorphic toxin [Morganella morganii]|uniref:HNH/endonuclease VII fold putative polymorphic toxin n=1 Tax=Morganella morganii TaxID=582 RepID=UPI00339D218E